MHSSQIERAVERIYIDPRDTMRIVIEGILKRVADSVHRTGQTIKRDRNSVNKTKNAQLVQTKDMVRMVVCVKNTIYSV